MDLCTLSPRSRELATIAMNMHTFEWIYTLERRVSNDNVQTGVIHFFMKFSYLMRFSNRQKLHYYNKSVKYLRCAFHRWSLFLKSWRTTDDSASLPRSQSISYFLLSFNSNFDECLVNYH